MASASYAIMFYPKDGLQYVSTPLGSEHEVVQGGFNRGLVKGWFWRTNLGEYYRITTGDESSVRELPE